MNKAYRKFNTRVPKGCTYCVNNKHNKGDEIMTWTTIKLSDRSLVKPYRTLEKKCIEIAQRVTESKSYMDESVLIEFNGGYISVIDSMLYIITKFRAVDIPIKLSKQISETGIKQLATQGSIIGKGIRASYSKGAAYFTKKQDYILNNAMINGLGDNPEYILTINDIKIALSDNSTLLGQLMTEAIVIAHMCSSNMDGDYIVNPFSLHSMIVSYWAFKNQNLAYVLKNMVIKIRDLSPKSNLKLHAQDELVANIDRLIKHQKSRDVAVRYLDNLKIDYDKKQSSQKMTSVVFYELLDDFIESMKIQVESIKWLKGDYERCKDEYLEGIDNGEISFSLMGKRNINKFAYAILSGSALMCNYMSMHNMPASVLYCLHMSLDKGIHLTSASNIAQLYRISNIIVSQASLAAMHFGNEMGRESLPKIIGLLDTAKAERDFLSDKVESLSSDIKNIKQQLKRLQKDNKVLLTDNSSLKKQIVNVERQYSGNISEDDLKNAQSHITELQSKLDKHVGYIEEFTRDASKKDKEIERLKDELRQAMSDYDDICGQLDRANSRILKMEDSSGDKIKLESYVNALKGKKIAIIGGDMLSVKASKLGLEFEHYKEHYNGIKSTDLIGMDLVVICTSYVGHTLKDGAIGICKTNDIKVLYHNKAGAEALIRSAFEAIYTD